MVISITTDNALRYRSKHLYKTLQNQGHELVFFTEENKVTPKSDVWIFEYRSNITDYCAVNIARLQYWLQQFLGYRGKLVLLNTSDGCPMYVGMFPQLLKNRVDAIVSFIRYPRTSMHSREMYDKIILLPRYTHDYKIIEDADLQNRENKIFFMGRLTGKMNASGFNVRSEAMKKISRNPFLSKNFNGYICSDPDHVKLKDTDLYSKCMQGVEYRAVEKMNADAFMKKLQQHTISLCLPGTTAWGYRHLQSLICKNTIVSCPLMDRDQYWINHDVFDDSFYFIQPDLSNFDEVLEYALRNPGESKQRAVKSFETYQKYFELQPDNSYKQSTWEYIQQEFLKCQIKI